MDGGSSSSGKPPLSLVVLGHQSCGKSVLSGHLIIANNCIDEDLAERIQNEAAAAQAPQTAKYSWILDKLKEERERCMTVDIGFWKLPTSCYDYMLIDVPGHRDFIKETQGGDSSFKLVRCRFLCGNMVTGASQADVALLVVSAVDFEKGFASDGQTREHAQLAFTLGVRQMIVAVTNMDHENVSYAEGRYHEIGQAITSYLQGIGFCTSNLFVVPVSGRTGANLVEKSSLMAWYTGPTLREALDRVSPPKRLLNKPLRIPVQDVYKFGTGGKQFTVAVGRIESGKLAPGMKITFAPSQVEAEVKTVEMHHQKLESAGPGDSVGFAVDIPTNKIRRGMVASSSNEDPARAAICFTAKVIVLNSTSDIRSGYTPVIDCHFAHVPCRFDKLLSRIDRRTGETLEENPKFLRTGDAGLVSMVPLKAVCVERFEDYPPLGRFAIRDDRVTVGVGMVQEVSKVPDIPRPPIP